MAVGWFHSLPHGWVSRRIKTISPVMRGASPRPIDDPIYFDDDGEYAWVRISDVTASDGLLTSTTQRLSTLGASKSVKLDRGKLFLSIAGSVGKPCITGIKACIHDGFVYFPYLPLESQKFLYWIFEARECFSGLGKLGTQLNLNTETVGNIAIPFPDLAAQRQIAEFLDRETVRIDLLIEKKQRLVALLGEQRAAAISSAVTVGLDEDVELVTTSSQYLPRVPATWRVWRLKHLAEIRGGLTLGRKIPDDAETTPTPYMRVANVQAGWLDLSDVAEIPVTEVEKKRYLLKHGDVLMNEGGDNDKLGRGAVWKSEIDTCVHQNHVFAVRPYDTRYSDWISLATNARYARDFFYLHSNQSTNLASISKTNLSRFPLAVPPIDQMSATLNALWDRVGKLDGVSEKTNTSIDRLKEYRSALITAAVTGQIDVTTYTKSGTPDRRLDAIQEEMGA